MCANRILRDAFGILESPMEKQAQITSLAEKLSWEVRELSLGTSGEIERIQGAPSPLRFLRDFVLPNKPCIITHAIDHWPALTAWSNTYLRTALADQQVSVHFTPDGFADALVDLNRISSVLSCIVEPPPPCNPLRTEPFPADSPPSSPHKPQLHCNVGAFANASADGRGDNALNVGENNVVYPPASSLHRPQSNHDVGASVKALADGAHIDFMGDAASKLQKNDVVHPPALSPNKPQLKSDVGDAALKLGKHNVLHPSASSPQTNCDVGAFSNVSAEAARIDDRGDAAFNLKNNHVARSGALKSHSGMGVSCNQSINRHQLNYSEEAPAHTSVYDIRDHVEQASSTDFEGEGPNSLPKITHNSSCSIESREERLQQAWFVTAHVERVPFSTALDLILHSEIGSGVAYAQEQNGCFLSEYRVLAADAETHLPWATEAFGCLPEAVNLWIGNEKAVTSFHKDHYENLYAVIAGEKRFTLLPPTDVHRLCIRKYPSAHYVKHKGGFAVEKENPVQFVPWVSVDPYPPPELASEAASQFPEYFNGPKPYTCTLQAGEILYLPSMWFHHVRQSPDSEGRTIALNFWYDMQFDIKYAYFNFLESLMHSS